MDFEFDESRRQTNLERHGIDFIDAVLLFSGPYLRAAAQTVAGETRVMAVGTLGGEHYVTAIYTERGAAIRIISMRSASRGERRKYDTLFGAGPS